MDASRNRRLGGSARGAFTLVELMVVIFIIGLLVAILLPSLQQAIKSARVATSQELVSRFSAGCQQFKSDQGYYPGQGRFSGYLMGSTPSGSYTGSQLLAISMFSDPDVVFGGTTSAPNVADFRTRYAVFTTNMLCDIAGRPFTIHDGFPDRMPILYYPARLTSSLVNSTTGAFRFADNSPYTTLYGVSSTSFESRIADSKIGGTNAVNASSFLLVAPGADRVYFNGADVQNW